MVYESTNSGQQPLRFVNMKNVTPTSLDMKEMKKTYQYSAPGSTMIMGEHAVLRGKTALVGAINKRITVTLTPQKNNHLDIYSALGEYHGVLDQLHDAPLFRFILSAIKFHQNKIPSGFQLNIDSEFSPHVGLGSSAAVVVGTLACIMDWRLSALDKCQLFLDARHLIQKTQGRGSGADIAASVFGGIIFYRMAPLSFQMSKKLFKIALIYTGYKTPTSDVIHIVDQHVKKEPEKYAKLFQKINHYSESAWKAIQNKEWSTVGAIMNEHQKLQYDLGVCDQQTSRLLEILQKNPHVLGCKISGSGLGDCVLALVTSDFSWKNNEFIKIDVRLSTEGLRNECS